MCLEHKSKTLVYREGKWEDGFEEYFEYINRAPSRLFLGFIQVPMAFLKCWVRTQREMGPRNVLIVGLVKSLWNMSFLNVYHINPRDKTFWTI